MRSTTHKRQTNKQSGTASGPERRRRKQKKNPSKTRSVSVLLSFSDSYDERRGGGMAVSSGPTGTARSCFMNGPVSYTGVLKRRKLKKKKSDVWERKQRIRREKNRREMIFMRK
jgi:hypothetical protein